jgi:hypothetical protein
MDLSNINFILLIKHSYRIEFKFYKKDSNEELIQDFYINKSDKFFSDKLSSFYEFSKINKFTAKIISSNITLYSK